MNSICMVEWAPRPPAGLQFPAAPFKSLCLSQLNINSLAQANGTAIYKKRTGKRILNLFKPLWEAWETLERVKEGKRVLLAYFLLFSPPVSDLLATVLGLSSYFLFLLSLFLSPSLAPWIYFFWYVCSSLSVAYIFCSHFFLLLATSFTFCNL